jgi:hypothetical protein
VFLSDSVHIVAISVAFWIVLECAAIAIVLLGKRRSKWQRTGNNLLCFAAKAALALPGIVFAGVLIENIQIFPQQPALYAMGAASSCVLLTLCMRLD